MKKLLFKATASCWFFRCFVSFGNKTFVASVAPSLPSPPPPPVSFSPLNEIKRKKTAYSKSFAESSKKHPSLSLSRGMKKGKKKPLWSQGTICCLNARDKQCTRTKAQETGFLKFMKLTRHILVIYVPVAWEEARRNEISIWKSYLQVLFYFGEVGTVCFRHIFDTNEIAGKAIAI